jgi:hypothetical protein
VGVCAAITSPGSGQDLADEVERLHGTRHDQDVGRIDRTAGERHPVGDRAAQRRQAPDRPVVEQICAEPLEGASHGRLDLGERVEARVGQAAAQVDHARSGAGREELGGHRVGRAEPAGEAGPGAHPANATEQVAARIGPRSRLSAWRVPPQKGEWLRNGSPSMTSSRRSVIGRAGVGRGRLSAGSARAYRATQSWSSLSSGMAFQTTGGASPTSRTR